nr:ECF-type sigma factor [Erythrobacter sp.]
LDSALVRLKAIDPGYAEIVEMRYFGGMSVPDVAEVTGWSEPTIKRRWQSARAWLADAIQQPIDNA